MSTTGSTSRRAAVPATTPTDEQVLPDRRSTRFAVPHVAADVLPRRRLLDLVRAGAEGPLTLVSAPAGCGKTTLVATWAALHDAPGTLTWMTLEAGDEQPDAFWRLLVEGLRRSGVPGLTAWSARSGPAARRAAREELAAGLAAARSPVVLVLDDADLAPAPALWTEVDDLLARTGGRMRLVLLTRRDPALPLARLRLDGAVTEIRIADLAFTGPEARTFLERAGIPLTPAELSALQDRTGGWPAGIRFAAMTLAGRPDRTRAIAEFSGAQGSVAEYLFTEVLDQKSPAVREVLLCSSVVDTLRPGLLDALTQSCEERCSLDHLAAGNAFLLPVPGTSGCYRYQPLFRDLLRAQLAYERPSLIPDLHRAAARWLADHGELLDATRHAAAAGDWSAAAGFVVDGLAVGWLLDDRTGPALRQVMRDLPDGEGGASGAVVRAALALHDGDLTGCLGQLDSTRAELDDVPVQRARSARVAVAALTALLEERTAEPAQALRSAVRADRLLTATGTDLANELRAQVGLCRARLLVQQGDLEMARVVLADLEDVARGAGRTDVVAEGLGLTALLEAVRGRLGRAVEIVDRIQVDVDGHGSYGVAEVTVPAAAAALAWVHTERFDDLRAAREMACRAEVMADRDYDPVTTSALAVLRTRLRKPGGTQPAGQPGEDGPPAGQPAWLGGGVPDAEAAAGPEIETTAPGAAVVGLLQVAERAVVSGDVERARRLLGRALDLAAPEQQRRPFLQASRPVRDLLRGGTTLANRHPWVQRPRVVHLPAARTVERRPPVAGPAESGAAAPVVEPLTAKEQEVLGHLAELLTTEEIAAAMYVSVNTVRTHVRGVLRKLAVTRRHEAVRRAWQLGLLERSGVG